MKTKLLGLMLLVVACAVRAADVDIPYEEFYLDNGLRVIVHEDRKAPIVAVTIWYHVGSKNEKRGKTGFAHLFEHLMFNGSENHDAEYFEPLEEVGGTSLNGTTDFDRTNYFQTVPATALDRVLWLESDRMGHLLGAIDQDKLDEQRGVVQNEKREGENEPYGKVFGAIVENLFPPDHPYSWEVIGSMEDLDAATLDDVRTWFETYYGPNNATLVLAGDIDAATAREKVERYFGDIPPGPPIVRPQRYIPASVPAKRIVMQDRVPEARVYKVWLGPEWIDDESTLLQLADMVLTSGKNARFYERLVYTDQIATSAGGYVMINEIAGAYVAYGTAGREEDLGKVEQALDEELSRFLAGGPTKQELERAKTEIMASFIRGIERVGGFSGKSNVLAENAVFGGRPDYYKHAIEVLESATPAQVRDVARKWLSGPALTIEVRPFPELTSKAPAADRTQMPTPDSFPQAEFPRFEQRTLPNGMRLIVAERHSVPVVEFRMLIDSGYAADQLAAPGVATMTMSMLDEGTATMDALEISDTLARLGAQLSAGANLDFATVNLSALTENLDASLAVYADVILRPAFAESDLERLRRLQLAAIQQEKNSPIDMALRVVPKLLYGPGHAYSLPMTGSGDEEVVRTLTRDDLVAFHGTWFAPNNATLIVVGDTTMREIAPKLERLFGGWRRADVPSKALPEAPLPETQRVFIVDRPGSPQSIVFATHLIPPKDQATDIAMDAMNDILGGTFVSRINMNLREDKAWAYGASSQIVQTQAQRPFIAYAPVQADKTAESMVEIRNEIAGMAGARPVTPQETAASKRRATLSLPGLWETASAVAGDIAWLVRYRMPDDYWDRYPDLVEALDTAQVADIAARTLAPDRLTWVVVGDRRQIEAPIRALGFGEVTIVDVDGNPVAAQ